MLRKMFPNALLTVVRRRRSQGKHLKRQPIELKLQRTKGRQFFEGNSIKRVSYESRRISPICYFFINYKNFSLHDNFLSDFLFFFHQKRTQKYLDVIVSKIGNGILANFTCSLSQEFREN